MTITEFLLARIAEDEANVPCANCGRGLELDGDDGYGHVDAALPPGAAAAEAFWADPCPSPEPMHRAAAECKAKRRIVDLWEGWDELVCDGWTNAATMVLGNLASVYVDHPDFRAEWRTA